MNLADIDKNFKNQTITETDVEWHSSLKKVFTLHGLYYEKSEEQYRRMPRDIAAPISDNLDYLSANVSGGRITFATDSPYIALKGVEGYSGLTGQTTIFNRYGFAIYDKERYSGTIVPEKVELPPDGTLAPQKACSKIDVPDMPFDGIKYFYEDGMHKVTLFFPLSTGVRSLYVGIKKGSRLLKYNPYKKRPPMIFYGSSITQGCCASRPGLDYINLLTRYLKTDALNLGFSGNAYGEARVAEYIAGLNASVYVLDYDHNAKTVDDLKKTDYPFYLIIRKANPETPVVFVSRPSFEYFKDAAERRDAVKEAYLKAKSEGDDNVYFIDGETLYGKKDRDVCCADTCHPTDVGFYRMAKTMQPTLKRILNGQSGK